MNLGGLIMCSKTDVAVLTALENARNVCRKYATSPDLSAEVRHTCRIEAATFD